MEDLSFQNNIFSIRGIKKNADQSFTITLGIGDQTAEFIIPDTDEYELIYNGIKEFLDNN
jgi:hypothetical protein